MSVGKTPSKLDQGEQRRLANLYEELPLEHLVDGDETWTIRDIDADVEKAKGMLLQFKWAGAIEVVGTTEEPTANGRTAEVNVYTFSDGALEFYREYTATRDALPCGHRAHVHHRDDGGYGCQYCEEERSFDRDVVEEAIDR